jgi:hypothetical protein
MLEFIKLSFAAYAFATGIQMVRGKYWNFKPINCRMCMSFWATFIFLILFTKQMPLLDFIINLIITPLAVSGAVFLLTQIEERLTHFSGEPKL